MRVLYTGLAQLFPDSECKSNRYVGKNMYKSPEIVSRKKKFDAKANDIWGLGVVLFSMIFGVVAWHSADVSDPIFACIINGKLKKVLTDWRLLHLANSDLIQLFNGIFKREEDRIGVEEIKQNKWFRG